MVCASDPGAPCSRASDTKSRPSPQQWVSSARAGRQSDRHTGGCQSARRAVVRGRRRVAGDEWAGLRQRFADSSSGRSPAPAETGGHRRRRDGQAGEQREDNKGVYSEEKGGKSAGVSRVQQAQHVSKATLLIVSSRTLDLTGICCSNDDGANLWGIAAASTPLTATLPTVRMRLLPGLARLKA